MGAWSVIQYGALHEGLDFDAEHYHPERIMALKKLSQSSAKKVADYAQEIDELVTPNPKTPSFDLTAALGQFLADDGTYGATSVKKIAAPGDLIVSRLRSYLREVCLVPERNKSFIPQLSTEFFVLRSHSKHSIAWLLPFILSQPVQTLLQWSQTGSNHPRFSIKTLLAAPIPAHFEGLIPQLNALTEQAVSSFEQSRRIYPEAEAELLSWLKWDDLNKLPFNLFYTRQFNEVEQAGRTDAEFFQPRVQTILSKLSFQKKRLKDVASLREEIFSPKTGTDFFYIEISDISENSLVRGSKVAGENAASRAKYIVHTNDVITSTVRPIRRLSGLIGSEQDDWVCSSGFAALQALGIPAEYLVAYLRLPPVCELMDAYTTATMYPAISVNDLLNLPFCIPPEKLLNRVCEAVLAARKARKEAEKKISDAVYLAENALKGRAL